MKKLFRWIYLHSPRSWRVWGNHIKTRVNLEYRKQPRGRTGPVRAEDTMNEHWGQVQWKPGLDY